MIIYVTSAEGATTKTGSPYLRIRYVAEDKINKTAVLFDTNLKPESLAGQVCEASITNGSPSNRVEKLSIIEGGDPDPFLRTTTQDVDAMLADLRAWSRGEGVHPSLTKVIDKTLFEVPQRVERFKQWPAASRNHHAFRGGLLEHTWGMCRLARAAMDSDPALAGVDRGVVIAGVIMHDLAKIFTYEYNAGAIDKVSVDLLLGHLVIADEMIVKACISESLQSTAPVVLSLRHCVLAHHGKLEWGSPIVPATREAMFLHQLDMMQSRNQMAFESLEGVEANGRSAWNKPLGTEMVRIA